MFYDVGIQFSFLDPHCSLNTEKYTTCGETPDLLRSYYTTSNAYMGHPNLLKDRSELKTPEAWI